MRNIPAIVLALLLLAVTARAAEAPPVERLYVRPQPSVALLSTPAVDGIAVRQLTPGDALTVIGRNAGFVNVTTASGLQGWLRETDLTATPPPAQRVAQLEQEIGALRTELADAQRALRTAQAQARQATQAADAARSADAGETAALVAERDRLLQSLTQTRAELETARQRVGELEMAQQAARLLAARQPERDAASAARFSVSELLGAGGIVLAFTVLGIWLGHASARRRLRRRYHGLEL